VLTLSAPPAAGGDAEWLLDQVAVQGGNAIEMNRWLPEVGNWSSHPHNLPFGNYSLEANRPYFLRATLRSLLRLPPGVSPMPSAALSLTTGWNFVALPPLAEPVGAEEACQQIAAQGGAAREIARWDAGAGNWASHICGLPFGDFCLTRGRGYFIRAQADSTWTPQPGTRCNLLSDTSAASQSLGAPAIKPAISAVHLANVRDASLAVSWLTDAPATGYVRYGADPDALVNTAHDDRDAGAVGRAHHVTLRGLHPETTYYIQLVSGETTSADLYRVATGPTLDIPVAHTAYGRILQGDGVTPAAGSLVYLALHDRDGRDTPGQADILSALTDEDGYWAVNLGAARSKYRDAYFVYGDGDGLSIEARHSPAVQAGQVVAVSQAAPAPALRLGGGAKVYLPMVGTDL
jgi:hypothetical protein